MADIVRNCFSNHADKIIITQRIVGKGFRYFIIWLSLKNSVTYSFRLGSEYLHAMYKQTAHSNVLLQLLFRWVDCCKSFSLHVQIQSTQSSMNVFTYSFMHMIFSHRFLCFHCQPVNHVLNRVGQHKKSCTIIVSYMTSVTVAGGRWGNLLFWQVVCVLEVVVMGKTVIIIEKKQLYATQVIFPRIVVYSSS